MERLIGLGVLMLAAYCGIARAQTVTYMHTDALGTPIAQTDAAGNVIETNEYSPYGDLLNRPDIDGPGYTGHVQDVATGMIYMQQRYYDPQLGLFLSVDPVMASSSPVRQFHRYRYADGSPYKFTDPDGRSSCADPACKTSFIDSRPARTPGFSPAVNGGGGLPKGRGGDAVRSASGGPHISFVNDNPSGASPNQPVATNTANLVERSVIRSGVDSVNINSTTGGKHSPTSNHAAGRAVDINRVNGMRADSPRSATAVRSVQAAARADSAIRENFGPAFNEKTSVPGGVASSISNQGVIDGHKNHIHISGQP